MSEVQIKKLSKAQLSRLRNGHGCKCEMAGKGMPHDNVRMSDSNLQKLIKGAGKGKACIISLSPEEREDNKVHGTGLMVGGKGKSMFSGLAKKGLDMAKKEGMKQLKKHGPELLDKAKDMAMKEGTKALSSLADQGKAKIAGAGPKKKRKTNPKPTQPPGKLVCDPEDASGTKYNYTDREGIERCGSCGMPEEDCKIMRESMTGAGRRKTKKERVIDLIEDIAENPPKRRGESRVRKAIDTVESMEGGSFWGKKGHFLGKHSGAARLAKTLKPITSVALDMAADYAGPEAAPMREAIRQSTGAGLYARSMGRGLSMSSMGAGLTMSSAGMRGGAIGARKGVLSVGNGGSFLCGRNPALQSQPYAANFFFNTQFPPSMQEQGIFGPYSGR